MIDEQIIQALLASNLSSNMIAQGVGMSTQAIINYRKQGIDKMTLQTARNLITYSQKVHQENQADGQALFINKSTTTKTPTEFTVSFINKTGEEVACTATVYMDFNNTMFMVVESNNETKVTNYTKSNLTEIKQRIPAPFNNLTFRGHLNIPGEKNKLYLIGLV